MAAPTREEFIAYLAAKDADDTAQAAAQAAAAATVAALATLEANVRAQATTRYLILASSDAGVEDGYYAAEVLADGAFQVHTLSLLTAA